MFAQFKQQLISRAPQALRIPVKFTPFILQQKTLEFALNQAFAEAKQDGDFEFLEGKWLKLDVSDIESAWFISYQDERLVVREHCVDADICFSGELNEFVLLMGRKEDPDTLFFQRRLKIEGDTELGLEVKSLIDNFEFEQLPSLVNWGLQNGAQFVADNRP